MTHSPATEEKSLEGMKASVARVFERHGVDSFTPDGALALETISAIAAYLGTTESGLPTAVAAHQYVLRARTALTAALMQMRPNEAGYKSDAQLWAERAMQELNGVPQNVMPSENISQWLLTLTQERQFALTEAIQRIRDALFTADGGIAELNAGAVTDVLWAGQAETLMDFLDACLERARSEAWTPNAISQDGYLHLSKKAREAMAEASALRVRVSELEAGLREMVEAPALEQVAPLVAGWSGPPEKPYAPHPAQLGAKIPTNCGRVYKLAETMKRAHALLAGISLPPPPKDGETK